MQETADMTFMFYLNQSLREEERIFKLKSAILKENNLTIKLLYSAENASILTELLKHKITDYTNKVLPDSVTATIEYSRTFSDELTIKTALMGFLYEEAVLIYPKIKDSEPEIEITPFTIQIKLFVPEYAMQYCFNSDLKVKTEQFISSNFMEDCELQFIPVSDNDLEERGAVARPTRPIKTVEIHYHIDLLHWGAISRSPRYIRDVIKAEDSVQVVCGKVSNFRVLTTKDGTRNFYVFRLNDTTATIDCKAFPRNKKAHANFEKITDGMFLAAEGNIAFDKFSKGKAIAVQSFSECVINFDSINDDIEYLPLPEKYATVFPEEYNEVEYEKFDMFHLDEKVPEQLKGKTFVVFDVETTGTEVSVDSIIEFGGVKMVDGKMTETLKTYVEPVLKEGETRSKESIAVNHITDEMLENAPKPQMIVGDIYKFCHGAILVGHNVEFDIGFLRKMGNEHGYLFDNATVDTLAMARERFRGSNKLKDVCQRLDVSLLNAHRALHDAIATAKIFKKMFDVPLLQGK